MNTSYFCHTNLGQACVAASCRLAYHLNSPALNRKELFEVYLSSKREYAVRYFLSWKWKNGYDRA